MQAPACMHWSRPHTWPSLACWRCGCRIAHCVELGELPLYHLVHLEVLGDTPVNARHFAHLQLRRSRRVDTLAVAFLHHAARGTKRFPHSVALRRPHTSTGLTGCAGRSGPKSPSVSWLSRHPSWGPPLLPIEKAPGGVAPCCTSRFGRPNLPQEKSCRGKAPGSLERDVWLGKRNFLCGAHFVGQT